MALTASCPSCGALVVFKSAASIFAVCEYCQSTLVRHDQALEDIGKMAALVEDRSPLQLGAEGSYKGVHFALIGRIQIKYSHGIWNEWHLLFDDMRTGWLSEAGGEYVLTFAQFVPDQLPQFDELKIGQRFVLASQTWTVSNIEQAECIAGQGELPFKVGAGYPLPAVDLRNAIHFATLDYSETPPLFFVGQALEFAALKMSNLRQGVPIPTVNVTAQVFRCPSCGSPMQARSKEILAVGCAACGAVVDTADANHRILSAALDLRDQAREPAIALGTKGRLDGKAVEMIGFLVRQAVDAGSTYAWREYLLAGENATYRWLTEYNGHWNIADVLSSPPGSSGSIEADTIRYNGELFKHFSTTQAAEVIQVSGEFTWRVRRGETCRVVDYVAPPLMLSRESTDNDLNWTQASYVAPEVIAEAFSLSGKLGEAVGVSACQPNPWETAHRETCRLFWKIALVALVLQALFMLFSGGHTLLRQDLDFLPQAADEQLTREFVVSGSKRRIMVRNETSLDNNWIGLNLTLVDKNSGAAWPATREVAFYHGNDGGESWSEGRRDDELVFLDVAPGTYYLVLDPDLSPERAVPVHDRLVVSVAGAGWSNFVMLLLFLVIFPVFTRLRHAAFEVRRWSESDHPLATGSDAAEDD